MHLGDTNDPRTALLEIIRQVRRRWRTKLAFRGGVRLLVATILLLLASAYALETLRFTPGSIMAFRILIALTVAGLAGWFLARPLLRRVSDEQVALYLEEHEPTLEATIITVMDAERSSAQHPVSPALLRRLIENAIEHCHRIERGARIEREPLRRYAAAAGIVAVAAFAVFTLGPGYLRHALSALLVISRSVEAAAPYRIEVTPGDATVPKGADQAISAKLHGFSATDAVLLMRKSKDAEYERMPMMASATGGYEGLLFDLSDSLEYAVEAAGVRSAPFSLKVVELPYTKRLDLEYHFPTYTGLAPRTVEDTGDVAALRGTKVRVKITPTMAAAGGRLLLNDGKAAPLTATADGTLTGEFDITAEGFYRVELDTAAGDKVEASPQYTIDILTDQAPSVTLSKPGRDTIATPVEEFFVEARADDDFAVRDLQLVYSINGGEEKSIRLFSGSKPLNEVTAGHTFYLEELGVEPGDSVSYFARATDNNSVEGPQRATSDMYFLRVRPFGKDFKAAPSMAGGGGGGGGGGGNEVGALSQQQRQIIAGTFNVQRDRRKMTAEKVREAVVVLALSQSRLREQVEGLVERMNSRLVAPDAAFKKIAELLPLAATEMKAAETKLQAQSPDGALPPEHKALKFLQQAEEEYELQVQMNRQAGGGGGGGGAGSIAEDLADLFKMELDKQANQYETAQRAGQENTERQIDELAEKLRELARRQEQELERQKQLAAGKGQSPRNAADLQRAMAEQAEEAARQLDRLSREQNRPDLRDAARRMQEAADAMRKAAAGGNSGSGGGQAAAAADRLREAQRQLQGAQGARAERDVRDALRQAEEIAREQREVADEARNLPPGGAERFARAQGVVQKKDALEKKVAGLERQLDRSGLDLAREERNASRKLQEAAEQIRDDKIKEKMRYSQAFVKGGGGEQPQARQIEDDISRSLDDLQGTLKEALSAVGRGNQNRTADALDKARELTRGVDSLTRRMQERGEERAGQQGGRSGNQNQQGQQGQQGREGQQGQGQQGQGQQGQQGREGQQGQGQQGQGQQGQGQQGQGQQGQGQQGQGQQGQQGQGQQGQGQQGQGQGGQQGQGGRADGQMGAGDTQGGFRDGAGGWGSRRPGDYFNNFTDEDIRQFRGEAQRWTGEARALREMLRQQNLDTRELDEILRRLRELEDTRVYRDGGELAKLQSFVTEGLKRFEFGLRRKIGEEPDRALMSGSEEVPQQFRRLVEEYYRSLSKQQQQQQQPPPRPQQQKQ